MDEKIEKINPPTKSSYFSDIAVFELILWATLLPIISFIGFKFNKEYEVLIFPTSALNFILMFIGLTVYIVLSNYLNALVAVRKPKLEVILFSLYPFINGIILNAVLRMVDSSPEYLKVIGVFNVAIHVSMMFMICISGLLFILTDRALKNFRLIDLTLFLIGVGMFMFFLGAGGIHKIDGFYKYTICSLAVIGVMNYYYRDYLSFSMKLGEESIPQAVNMQSIIISGVLWIIALIVGVIKMF